MIDTITPQVLQKFYLMQDIPQDLLQKKIAQDNLQHPFMTLNNLVTEMNISNYDFNTIKSYLTNLLAKINLDSSEQEWARLLLLIRATQSNFDYTQDIYQQYQNLPNLSVTNFHQWLEYEVYFAIVPYLNILDYDTDNTLDKIAQLSQIAISYNG